MLNHVNIGQEKILPDAAAADVASSIYERSVI